MTRHFGVLIPSMNTTVEIECRLLSATYQAHAGRLMSSGGGSFSPSRTGIAPSFKARPVRRPARRSGSWLRAMVRK
jgi:hypothetical protein